LLVVTPNSKIVSIRSNSGVHLKHKFMLE
jgi:hypothetical protein